MTDEYSLDDIRLKVTELDNELLRLLAKRRELSLTVAKSKIGTGKPVRDLSREHALLTRLITEGKQHRLPSQYITNLFQTIIEDSVLYQQAYLQQLLNPERTLHTATVSFLGPKGSYSHLASRHYFSRKQTDLIEVSCTTFRQIIAVVENGQADYGVLPIENTSSGSINEVYDLLQHTPLSIVGEIIQPIEHCLLTAKETQLEKITTLYSHSQPHQQCSEFVHSLGNIQQEYCSSTAAAMEIIADLQRDDIAAIGHSESGKLYGLTALKTHIANQAENHTRFIIVARKAVKVTALIPAKTTLIMSTIQKAGALVECLLVLRNLGLNMSKLESRPILGNPWEEMFYLDIDANLQSDKMQEALEQLIQCTQFIKVLGCYPSENIKPVEME